MSHTTTIKNVYRAISDNAINGVDFEMLFSVGSSEFAHGGFILLNGLPVDATDLDLISAVESHMIPHLPGLTSFYEEMAAINEVKATANIIATGPVVVTPDMVGEERTRRLAMGFPYDFGAPRGVHHIGTTDSDMKGWDEVTKIAQAAINKGDGSRQIGILTNTGPAMVTADEWQDVLLAAGEFRQPIFAASFTLQAMSPIPLDYTDNAYWP